MAEQRMLTTTDNPFNPFESYEAWNNWDITHGHHTSSLLDRVVVTSSELSEEDQAEALRDGMDEIIKYNVSGVHTIVTREV